MDARFDRPGRCGNDVGWPGPSPLAGNATCADTLPLPRRVGAGCRAVIRRPRTAKAIRQWRGSQGRNTTRRNRSGRVPAAQRARLAPRPWPTNLVAASLAFDERPWRAQTSAGAKRSDRRDSEGRDSEAPKPGPERHRSAAASFRRKRSLGFVAEPMPYRRTANPADAAPSGQPRRAWFSTARSRAPSRPLAPAYHGDAPLSSRYSFAVRVATALPSTRSVPTSD